MSGFRRGVRIGIDVGGTNTDAVVLDPDKKVLARHKAPTTKDLTSGIDRAMQKAQGKDPQFDPLALGISNADYWERRVLEKRPAKAAGADKVAS